MSREHYHQDKLDYVFLNQPKWHIFSGDILSNHSVLVGQIILDLRYVMLHLLVFVNELTTHSMRFFNIFFIGTFG